MYLAATQFDRVFVNQAESKNKLAAMLENIQKADDDLEVGLPACLLAALLGTLAARVPSRPRAAPAVLCAALGPQRPHSGALLPFTAVRAQQQGWGEQGLEPGRRGVQGKKERLQELAKQLEAAASVRDSKELADHVKRCIGWGCVWLDRAAVASADNRLEFELPRFTEEVSPAAAAGAAALAHAASAPSMARRPVGRGALPDACCRTACTQELLGMDPGCLLRRPSSGWRQPPGSWRRRRACTAARCSATGHLLWTALEVACRAACQLEHRVLGVAGVHLGRGRLPGAHFQGPVRGAPADRPLGRPPQAQSATPQVLSPGAGMQAAIMDGFNNVMEALSEDRAALQTAYKDAARDHGRARRQLANVEHALEEARTLQDGQHQGLAEAQNSVEETSQVGAGDQRPLQEACWTACASPEGPTGTKPTRLHGRLLSAAAWSRSCASLRRLRSCSAEGRLPAGSQHGRAAPAVPAAGCGAVCGGCCCRGQHRPPGVALPDRPALHGRLRARQTPHMGAVTICEAAPASVVACEGLRAVRAARQGAARGSDQVPGCEQAVREAQALLQKRKEHEQEMEANWKDAQSAVAHLDLRLKDIPRTGGGSAEEDRCCRRRRCRRCHAAAAAAPCGGPGWAGPKSLWPSQATTWPALGARRRPTWCSWSGPTRAGSRTCPSAPSAPSCRCWTTSGPSLQRRPSGRASATGSWTTRGTMPCSL